MPAAGKLAGIEGARGAAAAMVVLYHAARHMDVACRAPGLRALLQFGHAGVDVFFVLSGFIILFVHFDDVGRPRRLGRYVVRRALRVLPVYWVALGLTVCLGLAAGHGWPGAGAVFRSALLLPSWSEPLLGVAWTLQYEMVFYAAFAVLILERRAGSLLMAAWFLGAVAVCLHGGPSWAPPSLCSAYDLEFFLGMGVAIRVRRGGVGLPFWVVFFSLGAFALACGSEDLGVLDAYGNWGRLAYGVPAALLVLGLSDPRFAMPSVLARPLAVLGAASYSIYLFQFCWIAVMWQAYRAAALDRSLGCGWGVPILAAGGIAGGVFMSRAVEYPLMRILRARFAPVAV